MTIALYGTPCGGTMYTAHALQARDVNVGHEKLGPDGIACGWLWWGRPEVTREELSPDLEWRIYRDPLRVLETLPGYSLVPSIRTGEPMPWAHEDPVVAALRWWVLTHESIPADMPRLRIGERGFADDWAALMDALGVRDHEVPIVQRLSKPKRWGPWKWQDVARLDPDYAGRAHALMEALR